LHASRCSPPDLALLLRYKIGDSFFHVNISQAQEMLEASSTRIEEDVSQLEDKLSTAREEMTQLKVELYARFGKSINLET
jgi:prefoldin subunit 4